MGVTAAGAMGSDGTPGGAPMPIGGAPIGGGMMGIDGVHKGFGKGAGGAAPRARTISGAGGFAGEIVIIGTLDKNYYAGKRNKRKIRKSASPQDFQ